MQGRTYFSPIMFYVLTLHKTFIATKPLPIQIHLPFYPYNIRAAIAAASVHIMSIARRQNVAPFNATNSEPTICWNKSQLHADVYKSTE